jgi:hypothetical protein
MLTVLEAQQRRPRIIIDCDEMHENQGADSIAAWVATCPQRLGVEVMLRGRRTLGHARKLQRMLQGTGCTVVSFTPFSAAFAA